MTEEQKDPFEITGEDLNDVDRMNGSSSISPNASHDKELKGAWAKYNGQLNIQKEKNFIAAFRALAERYEMERFEYNNLPQGLTKIRLETKIINSGSCVIFKDEVSGEFFAANYSIENFNMYDEPTQVYITEPKAPLLNGKKIDILNEQGVIIRNNKEYIPTSNYYMRFIVDAEKALYQLEKNLLASAPKAILNTKSGTIESFADETDNQKAEQFEATLHSERTFFQFKNSGDFEFGKDNEEKLYIPIELNDRTELLIKNFTFFKEQLKEQLGAMNNIHQKKERVNQDEIEQQQGFSTSVKQHAYNIRVLDIDKVNEIFGTNITIEYQTDTSELNEEIDKALANDPAGKE